MKRLIVSSQASLPSCVVEVDRDGFIVTCKFSSPGQLVRVRSTSEYYDYVLGIPGDEDEYVFERGVMFRITKQDKLCEFEWRAGPNALSKGTLPVFHQLTPASIHFAQDCFRRQCDDDASGDAQGIFDPESRTLRLEFVDQAVRWVAIADRVAVAVSSSDTLAAVQIGGVPVDLCDLVGCKGDVPR